MKSSSANKNKRARLASDTKQLKVTKHPPKNIIQLLVYNMNATTKEEQLKNHIKKYGKVIQVFVPFIGKKIRGFGFVTMENNDVTLQELNNFDTKRLDGEYIRLIANENQSEFVDPEDNEILTLDQIFSAKVKSNVKKMEKLDQFFNQCKNQSSFQLIVHFDMEQFKSINENIVDASTEMEQLILNILEVVIGKISQLSIVHDQHSKYQGILLINEIRESGIYSKIVSLLKKRVKFEENNYDNEYSILTEQLFRIYLQIIKDQILDQNTLDICQQILVRNITLLINILRKEQQADLQQGKQDINEDKLSIRITSLSQTLYSIRDAFNWGNNSFQAKCMKLHQTIAKLIHINCPSDTNCENCIKVRKNISAINQLHLSVYEVIGCLCKGWNDVQNYLRERHHIIQHIAPIINNFSNNHSQLHQQLDVEQKQKIILLSSSDMSIVLQFLLNLIVKNSRCFSSEEYSSNIIQSVIQFIKYNINDHIDQYFDKESLQIRNISLDCMSQIMLQNSPVVQSQISKNGFICSLVQALSSASGYSQKNIQINKALIHINQFISIAHIGLNNQYSREYIPPQLDVSKICEEQIEEQCGNEEIEAQLINFAVYDKEIISSIAKQALCTISNFYVYHRKLRFDY